MTELELKRQLTHKLREELSKDYDALYVKEYSTMWETERFLRKSELNIMSLDNSVELISKIIAEARADQNKKIGEDLTKILLDDTIKNSISRCRTITDYVADNLIAKLQKGDSPE